LDDSDASFAHTVASHQKSPAMAGLLNMIMLVFSG